MNDNKKGDWKNNPRLSSMDKGKLDMLQNLAEQGLGKSPSDMLPFLLSAASQGKNNGLNFSSNEIAMILDVMKTGKSPEEVAKINRLVRLMSMIR